MQRHGPFARHIARHARDARRLRRIELASRMLRRLAQHAGCKLDAPKPARVPRMAGYVPGKGAVPLHVLRNEIATGQPLVPIVFYRSALLAADTAPIDGLCAALQDRGLTPAPLFVPSLKDKEAGAFVRETLEALSPAAIVTATAFAADVPSSTPSPAAKAVAVTI